MNKIWGGYVFSVLEDLLSGERSTSEVPVARLHWEVRVGDLFHWMVFVRPGVKVGDRMTTPTYSIFEVIRREEEQTAGLHLRVHAEAAK